MKKGRGRGSARVVRGRKEMGEMGEMGETEMGEDRRERTGGKVGWEWEWGLIMRGGM